MTYEFDAGTGLTERTVDYISLGQEGGAVDPRVPPQRAEDVLQSKPLPTHWATKDLENINFDKIRYYLSQGQKPKRTWDEVPDDIKRTFERLGIPEQERKFLAGVEAQFDSEAAYSNIKEAVVEAGRHLRQLDRGPARAPGDLPQVVRQGHPDRRQQVLRAQQRRLLRRLVHLRARRA